MIKSSAPHVPPADSLTRFRNEWFIARMFDTPAVPHALELIEDAGAIALVFEGDEGLVALDQRVASGRLSVRESLLVGLGIVDALAEVHAKSVVHKDIKPGNILVDASLSQVVLIDFGIATVVPRELGRPLFDGRFEGSLGYVPPEQTGRVNRPIDYRSDYYGLGATLYWMLSGDHPFADLREPDELLHAQLARVPPMLDELDPRIPPVLARIVAKLLSKAAEDRYQGSYGLRADLSRCLDSLELTGATWTIEAFEIARVDPCERLRQPRRLYGRDPQRAQLDAAFSEAADIGPSLVIVRGPSGSGKSGLVGELADGLRERDVVFAACKFDQFTRASPHAGVGQILGSLLEQLAAGSLITDAQLKQQVRAALGPNGGLLSDIVPELEGLLGPLGHVVTVGPAEARDRFWDTLERLTDALLVPEHDFVVFIDDVQWADASSLRLLETLCLGPRRRLTLVLASRDDALEPSHPLTRMLGGLERSGFAPVEIEVGALTVEDVAELVADVLDRAPQTRALAELLHRRTQGTPLYVTQLLMAFYTEGIVDMDRATGQWCVDMDRAARRESSGDVVDFLVRQFEALPEQTRRVLGVAACVGTRFDLDTLAAALGEPISAVGSVLWGAVSTGHLSPMSSGPRPLGFGAVAEYGFVHDRVQQVALESLPEDRGHLYLSLARRLSLAQGDAEIPRKDHVHTLAGYIAQTRELITDPEEQRRFAALCAEAGTRAKAAAAFESAASHFADALALMAGGGADRAALFALTLDHAESLAMAGDDEAAELEFGRARELVDDPRALAVLLLSRVTLAMVPGHTDRALELVMEAAEIFELDLRRDGSQEWVAGLMAGVLAHIERVGPASIPTRPGLEDPQYASIAQMLLASTNAAYLAGDINLYAALGLTMIEIGLEHGVDDVTGIAFIQLALVVASGFGDYEGARRYAGLGVEILERFPASPLWGMADVILGSTVQPWIEPMAPTIPRLKAAHTRLQATGMITNAGYASFCVVMNAFMIGTPLPRVLEQTQTTIEYLDGIGDRPLALATRAHLVACQVLSEPTLPAVRPTLVEFDDGDPGTSNPASRFVVNALRTVVHALLLDDEGVAAALEEIGPHVAAGTGLFTWVVFKVIALVHGCGRFSAMDAAARTEHEAAVDETLAMLTRWDASCPANARPFVHLLKAAWAQARGELERARVEYDAAADAAAASGFNNFEGLACERGAEVLLALGDERSAVGYLEYARRSYGRWGARALERRIVERLRALGHARSHGSEDGSSSASGTIHALDASSIVKMSLALSETTRLSGVVAQLLTNASQNAGADRSAVLLDRDGELVLHADQVLGQEVRTFEPAIAIADADELLAVAVVRACVRRQEPVIIDDAQTGLGDKPDAYLRRTGLRSILALPVVKRGEQMGVLYLENRVIPGAFTRQHLWVLNTLAAQAAVTLDNAHLFDALRAREAQWRALVNSAPDTIMIVDRDHRLEFINRGLVGDGADQIIGARIESFVVDEDRPRVGAAIDYVFATGAHSSYEVSRVVDGERRRFTTRLGPISSGPEVDRVTLISTDVTEQRELEQQFRQSQKMQAIGTLAGGVAHDFNNLLMVIMGASDLGALELERLGIAKDAPPFESFEEIAEAAQRATQLTRQLLAFSRKQVLQPKRFDLNGLVDDVARMLTRLIGEHIELVLALAPGACGVHADPGQLEQVVINLAVNARDAMPRGGVLTISTGRCEFGPSDPARPAKLEPGAYVALEVADTGAGIAPDVLRRMFEPFFTTKDKGKGTGLGLSTVLGIIEQSGGHVTVDSQLGAGTRFRIFLPADDGEADRAQARPRGVAIVGGHETILVVEDDDAVSTLVAKILRARGYRVLVARDGDEALARAHVSPAIDLVLTDVVLPGASGPEVAAAIVDCHPRARVIYTSGYADDAAMRRGLLDGVVFLDKPFKPEALAIEVRRLLDKPHTEE